MNDLARLKNKIAVIGVGNTKYGNFPATDEYGLAAQAFRNAVEDSGIDKSKIDGLLVCRIPYYARMGEVLGLDPLYVANEGKLLAIVVPERAKAVLQQMQQHPLGRDAAIIGEVVTQHPGMVLMKTQIGGTRVLDVMFGEQLPRIC